MGVIRASLGDISSLRPCNLGLKVGPCDAIGAHLQDAFSTRGKLFIPRHHETVLVGLCCQYVHKDGGSQATGVLYGKSILSLI